MQWTSVFVGAAVSAAAFLVAGRVFSGDAEPKGGVDTSSVTAEHEALKAYEGTWDGKGTLATADASMTITSRQTGRMIMGGRFLQLDSEIKAGESGIKMMEIIGFDPHKKKYVHFALEDDSTVIAHDEGTRDAAKKLVTMHGTDTSPDGKERKYRYTISDPAGGAFHIDFFADEGAGEYKMLSWDFKKK